MIQDTKAIVTAQILCQYLQAEHMDMRVIDCIDCSLFMEVGPAHSLIP
jgi:hypothetical protein